MRILLASPLLLLACNGAEDTDLVDDRTPKCDGVQQELEETVDAPFDRDGDGFFDGSDPGCASIRRPEQLDCDDDDPDVNPSAFEISCDGVDNDCRLATPDNRDTDGDGFGVCDDCDDAAPLVNPDHEDTCFDGIDNDCDGTPDNDCGEDYNGTWQLDGDGIDVTCQPIPILPPFVDVDFDQVIVTWLPPHLTISAVGTSMPPAMDGTADPDDGTFEVAMTVGGLTPGVCQERYLLQGTFTGATTLEGVFSFEYVPGSPGSCGGCNLSQSFDITAARL